MRRLALLVGLWPAISLGAEDLGLRVPPGFCVTLFADHTLANDIFTMALDEKGRVVVSGPGYVRRLEDTDGDGRADRAIDIAKTKTGAMGLLFAYDSYHPDTFDLYTAADGKVRGHNGDHVRNLYPLYHEMVPTFPFSEHGGHALKIGPDGYLYAIAGNDGRIDQLKRSPLSPIGKPEAGGIVRFRSWERAEAEVIAHGFRNPYDFDFTPLGDIITYDSDTERDFLLPWYMPTRVYHVLPGGHHGWRLPGYMRSLARPDYYPDTVPMLADMGRGSPTGVCCYRHTQFPMRYRGGVFVLDWTFGRVYYLPLIPEGSSYQKVAPEVFLEPTGTNGFAPTAARVAPDGSLFISIGGRGTRGGVFRVEYRVDGEHPPIPRAGPDEPIYEVLDAPQPLEAWSQARWIPLASRIDTEEFERVAVSEDEPDKRRIRAMEVIASRKARLPLEVIDRGMKARSPFVRARVAWLMQEIGVAHGGHRSWKLVTDPHPRVRAAALEALAVGISAREYNPRVHEEWLRDCLGHADHRVRAAAVQVVSRIVSDPLVRGTWPDWKPGGAGLWKGAGSRLLVSLLVAYANSGNRDLVGTGDLLFPALRALEMASSSAERVDAIRAVMIAMGDWNLGSPKVELHSAYGLGFKDAKDAPYFRLVVRDVVRRLVTDLPKAEEREVIETTRLLAMVEIDDPSAVEKVLGLITKDSHPTLDFHYLTVLSRMPARRTDTPTERTAAVLLGLDAKLAGRHLRIKQNWGARLGELAIELARHDPNLGAALVGHPEFVRPAHIPVAVHLKGRARSEAARKLLAAVRDDEEFPLTPDLVELLAQRPPEEVRPVFRARWSDRSARDAMVIHLAANPAPADRDRLLEAVETTSGPALAAAVHGLAVLQTVPATEILRRLVPRLREALADAKGGPDRKLILGTIERYSGRQFRIEEPKKDSAALAAAYRPVFDWFAQAHPGEAKRLNQVGEEEEAIRKSLAKVNWSAGDVERGRKIYRDRSCLACHSATTRIGPDLAGLTKRLSRDDLLTAILSPSRDVAPAYRLTNVDLKDGKRVAGVVVFESADGLIVQTGAAETRRIATEDIETTAPSPKSLMPDGLLRGLKPEDLADLFAFLGKL